MEDVVGDVRDMGDVRDVGDAGYCVGDVRYMGV